VQRVRVSGSGGDGFIEGGWGEYVCPWGEGELCPGFL
jgi:hypothetical protein